MLTHNDTKAEPNSCSDHIAAIDLGSNSFHMVVAKISHGEIRVVDKFGEKVQLAAGLDENGEITPEAHIRAIECLKRFSQRIKSFDSASVQIVGTNALRAAKKKTDFLRDAERVTGHPIEIISGREEARLIYLGVAHTLADDKGNRLVIDIGGGSTELIIGERFEAKALESMHMGCVSFREKYFPGGELTEQGFNKAIKHASRELFSIKEQYKSLGWQHTVGASGSIKAILNALRHLGLAEETITLKALKELKGLMITLGHCEDLVKLGVKSERASIFAAGFSILYSCFKVLGIKEMEFTSGALREGLLYDILGRIQHEDVRERSLQSMQARYAIDVEHAERVEKTALHAYKQIASYWDIALPQCENLLRWASRVFEVGHSIAHAQYHRHGAYLVYHSDLPGFSRLTQLHLSVIVRTHRRKFSDEPFIGMSKQETQTLKRLCTIFRLAVALTAERNQAETDFTLRAQDECLSLSMGKGWFEANPLNTSILELEQDLLRKQGFLLLLAKD
ncbi:exopolyphosphatase [Oleiphilus sp. HI0081]|uniref:exopolyphosphatase n=2 Tax=Oleiphilus TaxID=141450 RepID=UPI0007C2B232|nr:MULTISPECIES: exopolyphosphatase [unclassified Oleiphilus]KZY49736.1 exopolyphosphatase [Oleiphilus sp. HI0050]KZY88753.1 exopolyphosphatase [Oleiphilus sp. HI0072]KZZ10803.1 exopolyphosphatase [Oleiphilus sp. HI0078]KZZ25027.1 exopolyphosphatase [Oleiphilus sp. HI0081]KZY39548.1 exopolyphosphatase [Oleiphilus sp. HI0043]